MAPGATGPGAGVEKIGRAGVSSEARAGMEARRPSLPALPAWFAGAEAGTFAVSRGVKENGAVGSHHAAAAAAAAIPKPARSFLSILQLSLFAAPLQRGGATLPSLPP